MEKLTAEQMNELISNHPELAQHIYCTGNGRLIAKEVIEKLQELQK
ncbi:hypothetical protein [Paenibacillus sp. O199]|nr:hypothetical protein [Paenibacillus sp. O199]